MHYIGDEVTSGEHQYGSVRGGICESGDIVLCVEDRYMHGCWFFVLGLVEQTQRMLVWMSKRGCGREEVAGEVLSGEEEPGMRDGIWDE